MFQKMIDVLVDEIILGKGTRNAADAKISESNPLIYPRQNRSLEEYSECLARDIEKKTALRTEIPQKVSGLMSAASLRAQNSPFLATAGLVSFLCFMFMRPVFFVGFFIIIGAVSRGFLKHVPFLTGFDFCLFFSIVASVAYGPAVGFFVGVVSSLAGSYLREISRAEYYFTPLYGFVPVFIIMSLGIVPAANFLMLSMVCVVSYLVARLVMIQIIYGACIVNQATYISTTLVFNYILFSNIAPALLPVL